MERKPETRYAQKVVPLSTVCEKQERSYGVEEMALRKHDSQGKAGQSRTRKGASVSSNASDTRMKQILDT